MATAVDGRDMEGIAQAVEGQRACKRDDDAAIDEAAAEAALPLRVLVEMYPRRVLVEAGGHLMLGLFERHPIDMIDPVADLIVAPQIRRACEPPIIGCARERRYGCAEGAGRD